MLSSPFNVAPQMTSCVVELKDDLTSKNIITIAHVVVVSRTYIKQDDNWVVLSQGSETVLSILASSVLFHLKR